MLVASAGRSGTEPLGATTGGTRLLAEPRDRLVSVAVSAAAASVERRRLQEEAAAGSRRVVRPRSADLFPGQVLYALARRRLPFSDADVELLLDLGVAAIRPDHPTGASFETLSFAVSAARSLLDSEPGSPVVLAALGRARTALDGVRPVDAVRAARVGGRISALLAANVPGGLLDLSIVDRRDGWARPALAAFRRHARSWDETQRLVALLAEATGTRPTNGWRRRSAELASEYAGYGDVLRDLLEPLLTIELVPSGLPRPPVWLLAPQNEILVKGAAWGSADAGAAWAVSLLGRLALRCGATTSSAGVTRPLASAVARAAVEALTALDTEAARAELEMLLGEIRQRALLRRIATVVGEPAELGRMREERLRRERRATRRGADGAPTSHLRDASQFVRAELAPALARAGFDSPTRGTFRRSLPDRVEVLHSRTHPSGVTLELGIWFRFVPRAHPVPTHDGRPRPDTAQCDFRGTVHAPLDDLGSTMRLSALWFARWRSLTAVLRRLLDGGPSDDAFGWGAAGSPRQTVLAGYVARETGDRRTARVQLRRAASRYRAHLDGLRHDRADGTAQAWDAWIERVEEDARTA